LVDAIGAFVTACLLGIALVRLESVFGVPSAVLTLLAFIAIGFTIYDLLAYFFMTGTVSKWIRGIAALNLSYCILSLTLWVLNRETITYLGWMYLVVEIIIIFFLIRMQIKIASQV